MEPKELSELTEQDFRQYEDVRKHGRWNMSMRDARYASGLDSATYGGVMKHYGELMDLYPEVRREATQ